MRSHHCGNLNIKNLNEEVTICGWIHRRRDHGGVIFLDVRDTTGIVQVVVNPENEQACLDGSVLNDLQSKVNLRWTSSKNSSKYQISIKNLNDNSNLIFESNSNSQEVILKHGEPYAWKVTAEVPESSSSLTSKEWRFYLAGLGEVNYAPFPPELISPRPSAKVNLNSNDQVLLNWSCSDPDGDIKGYKVYLDSTDGSNLIASFDETKNQVLIAVGETDATK